jgi:hypothetical protein
MIGSTYRSKAAQAVLGPSHSGLIPEVLWTGWLDATGTLVAMTGLTVAHSLFGPATNGVTNTATVDCGVAGTGWSIKALGLFDAAAGVLIVAADLPAVLTPALNDALVFEPGNLLFVVA